jgi:alpha-glucosidase
VPLPWTSGGPSFGFGPNGAHLPQPAWFADTAVDVQDGQADSTLEFYRAALRLRRELQGSEELAWADGTADDVLHFVRPGGWHCITNFGSSHVALPAGTCRISSGPLRAGDLPPGTTAWLTR